MIIIKAYLTVNLNQLQTIVPRIIILLIQIVYINNNNKLRIQNKKVINRKERE